MRAQAAVATLLKAICVLFSLVTTGLAMPPPRARTSIVVPAGSLVWTRFAIAPPPTYHQVLRGMAPSRKGSEAKACPAMAAVTNVPTKANVLRLFISFSLIVLILETLRHDEATAASDLSLPGAYYTVAAQNRYA